jgi:transcriptional regulator with XRE-family HTH domain
LRRLREDRGLSIRGQAVLCGVEHSEIYRIETGQQECRIETLIRLCGPLGVAAGWVLDHTMWSNVSLFNERVMASPDFARLADSIGANGAQARRAIAGTVANAGTLAAILIRSSTPRIRAQAGPYPHELWQRAFARFADQLESIGQAAERGMWLRSLLIDPVRELRDRDLLPEGALLAQVANLALPRARRQDYGWAAWFVPDPVEVLRKIGP